MLPPTPAQGDADPAAKAYLFPGGTIASDIGSAVAEAQVSDDVKKMLVPGDADASAKANATATHWLQNALTAANDDPIAVLVYVTTDSGPDEQHRWTNLVRHAQGSQGLRGELPGEPDRLRRSPPGVDGFCTLIAPLRLLHICRFSL